MPDVLYGLNCFQVPVHSTSRSVAQEFSAALDLATAETSCCEVEVYRLERLALDAQLAPEDMVVCRLPSWHFDLGSLEDLHRQVDDTRAEYETLQTQYARMEDAFIALNSYVEADELAACGEARAHAAGQSEATETQGGATARSRAAGAATARSRASPQADARGRSAMQAESQEVQNLRLELVKSERKQQEAQAAVVALRSEFMHLVELMSSTSGSRSKAIDLNSKLRELDASVKSTRSQESASRSPKSRNGVIATAAQNQAVSRPGSQPPLTSGRRPNASPRPGQGQYRTSSTYTTPRADSVRQGARPQVGHSARVQPRVGHSAGPSLRYMQAPELG